jgi:hypothetical protein
VLNLGKGRTVEVTYVGTAATYEGGMTGDAINYAERWRLSFPQLTSVTSYPLWVSNGFSRDIEGLSHDPYNTIMSRTQYSAGGTPQYGVLGAVEWTEALQDYEPNGDEYDEPADWRAQGYTHYGDIVFNWDVSDLVYIGMSKAGGTHGSIGAWSGVGSTNYYSPVEVNPAGDVSWLAVNPRNKQFYSSEGYADFIQRCTLNNPVTSPLTATANILTPIALNTPIDGAQGGKVSRHGKLWISSFNQNNCLVTIWGVDPYSGIVQTVAQRQPDAFDGEPNACDFHNNPNMDQILGADLEAEGLDLTDPNVAGDIAMSSRPGVSGQIHAQVLHNGLLNDSWEMLNWTVSDLDRL